MRNLDRIAVGLSLLCVAHCVALPLALLLPAMAWFSSDDHHAVHWGLLAAAAPISAVAFYFGSRAHGDRAMWPLGILGVLLMLGAVTESFGAALESPFTIVGALLLAMAHVLNQRGYRGHTSH